MIVWYHFPGDPNLKYTVKNFFLGVILHEKIELLIRLGMIRFWGLFSTCGEIIEIGARGTLTFKISTQIFT